MAVFDLFDNIPTTEDMVDIEMQPDSIPGQISIPYTDDLEATSKGLVITGNPDFYTWHSLWQWLKERDAAMPWILGDMMLYGESAFGEQASQVLDSEDEQNHFAPGTLKQYRYVANKWPQSSRLDLPWSYHQATAHLPIEQRMALMQHCLENDIKRAELRQLVRELNDGQNPNPPASLSDTNHELTEDNHKKDRRIAELETELAELQQAVIMPEPPAVDPTDFPDLNDLALPIAGWLQNQQTFSAVIIRRNGRIEIEP